MTAMPIGRQAPHRSHQCPRLRRRQGRSGLIEDEDARIAGDGLGDLHQLTRANGQLLDQSVRVDLGAHTAERRGGLAGRARGRS